MRVLLVDDDTTILSLVGQYLSFIDEYVVSTAPSAMDALEEIEDAVEPFDCFILDIQMPEIDGVVLTKLIRDIPGYQFTPIVMLTAMHDMQYLNRAFSAGATDYLTKPFDYEDLTSRLSSARRIAQRKEERHKLADVAQDPSGAANDASALKLDRRVSLDDLDTAIDPDEFENYVFELSRRRFFGVAAYAVSIGSLAQVCEDWASEDVDALVRNIARLVESTLMTDGGIQSYLGNGTFLCVPACRPQTDLEVLEASINRRFNVLHPQSSRKVTHLFVTGPVTLGGKSKLEAANPIGAIVAKIQARSETLTSDRKGQGQHARTYAMEPAPQR